MTVEHFPMEILHIMHVVTEVRTDKNVMQNLTLMLPVFKLEVLHKDFQLKSPFILKYLFLLVLYVKTLIEYWIKRIA